MGQIETRNRHRVTAEGQGIVDRRGFLAGAAAALATTVWGAAGKAVAGEEDRYGKGAAPVRYPDPDILVRDPRFARIKIGNSAIQRLHTGMLWAEGPAWNGVGRYLVWSDIPNDV